MNLPNDWKLQRLDVVADVRLGRQRSPKNHDGPDMRPYLRAANVGWSGLLLDDVKLMNFDDREMQTYRLVPDDILLAEASGSPGEVGKPALWNGEIEDCAFQNTLLRVRAHGVQPRYLLHYFRSVALTGGFADQSRGVGIHHLGRETLARWQVPVPPAEEQRRIVETLEEHLSRLDAARTYLEMSRERADSLEMALIDAALAGRRVRTEQPWANEKQFVVERQHAWRAANGDRGLPPAASPDGIDDLIVPPGWIVGSIEEVTDPVRVVRYGILKPRVSGGTVPYVEVKDLSGYSLDGKMLRLTSADLDAQFSGARLIGGDVVIAVRGSYERCAIVPETLSAANMSRDVARMAPLPSLHPEYLWTWLRGSFARRYLNRHARGVAVKGVNISSLRSMPIAVPPPQVQAAIVELTLEDLWRVGRLRNEIQSLMAGVERLRLALLQAAFSGRLTKHIRRATRAEELVSG